MEAADSDHSLTWEDFYGSTTDLTPTLISILESKFADGDKKSVKKDDVKRKMVPPTTSPSKDPRLIAGGVKLPGLSTETPVEVKKSPPSKPSYVSRLKSFGLKRSNACESKEELNSDAEEVKVKSAEVVPKMEPNKKLCPEKNGNSFDNLSPNVKRMLSMASDDSKPLTMTQQKKSNLAGIGRSSYRTKQSNIPLMGATSKITQTGVEIVSTADIYDKPSTLTRISVRSSTPVRAKDWSPKAMLSFSPEKKTEKVEEAPTVYDVPTNPAIYDVPKANTKVETGNTLEVIPQPTTVDLKANEDVHRLKVPATVTRPLSTSSIASSSSTSSSGVQNKGGANSAYLASIESLDDHSDAEYVAKNLRTVVPGTGSPLANDSVPKSNDANIQTVIRPTTPPRPRYCDPSLSLLERVCTEIVDTENVYVEDLRQVVEGYLYTWRGKGTFAPEQLDDLFSNIEEIYNFNKKFSQNLNECNLEAIAIAKCFVNHSSGFGIYTEYCTGYPGTMAALARLVGAPESAQPFRAQQAELGHALPLGSYLLKPVQRILKYHLLLQNLVKQCKSHETEYALHKMTGIAHHINDMKRRHEHAVRVQEIQSLLYGWSGQDLTTYGELCAEGTFRVFGAKALRHAFLFDKMLLLTKNKEYGMLAYKSHILCNNLMLVESIQGQPLSFHVIPFDCPRMQVTLQARSIQHKREWTLLLKRVILENYSAVIPSHARQLVMELGQNKTDDDILAEKSNALISHSSMRKQMSAPEYLEKRKMDRDRRKSFESGLRYRLKRSATRKEPSYDSVVENEETEKEQVNDSACEEICSCNDESANTSNVHLCPTCKNTYICNDCHNDTVTSSSFNCDDSRSSTEHFYDNSLNECSSCHKSINLNNVDVNVSSYSCENLKINQFSDKISLCHKCNSPMSFDKNVKENRKNIYDRLITIGPNIPEMNELRKTCLRCLEIRENITAENRNVATKSISKDDLQTLHVPKMSSQRRKSEPGISSINMNEIQPNKNRKHIENLKTNVTCKNCGKSLPKPQKTLCGKHSQNDAESPKNIKVEAPKNVNIEVKMYNAKTVPKKISKIKKNRAKTLRHRALDPTAKFYTDFTNDVGDSVLHISESTDSINTLNSQPNDTETSENIREEPKPVTKIPDGIDEETYKSLIQKTDSFKKSELEKDKLVSQNKQSSNVDEVAEEHPKDKTSNNTDSAGDVEEDVFESGDDAQNEKPLEVIISQLLMQNREFQKILKRHQLRNASNRRHQRLLKSYSNPEKTMQQMKDSQNKVKPKYGRQNSAIETVQISDDLVSKKMSEMNEEHIYETLMITSQKLIDESSSITNNSFSKNATCIPKMKAETENVSTENKSDENSLHTKTEDKPRLSLTESDYVYLCFDGKKNVLAYELPNDITKSINCEDLGVYAVPSALPKRASVDIVERRMVRDEIPVDNRASHDYLYENASEIWKRVSNDTVIENKPDNNCIDYSDSENVPQSPNLPEIWLDRQKEHFNTPRDKKSGSLPRSFHLVLDDDQQSVQSNKFHKKPGAFNKVYLNKEGKVLHSDRPFTIASDRSEISYEDIERFIKTNENSVLKFPNDSVSSNRSSTSFLDENADDVVDNVSRSTLELEAELEQCYKNKFGSGQEMKSILNNSLSSLQMKLINRSISSSLEVMNDKKEIEISHEDINVQSVHPEHRIYKPTSNILSLKSVLNKFKSKIRSSHENINSDELSVDKQKKTPPKNHSRNLLQRLISVKNDEQNISETITENVDESEDLKDKTLKDTPVKVTIEHVDSNKNNELVPSKSFCEDVTSDLNVSVDEVSRSCNNISLSPKTPDMKANMSQSAQFAQIYNSAIVNKVARSTQDLNKLPIYRQGSQLLGARIAQSDYADPKLLKMNSNSNINTANVLINKHALRPDSLLSNSSHFTSSSEGCITSNNAVVKNNSFLYRNNSNDSSPNIESDKRIEKTLFKLNSDESFYEKSFEEIEHILDDEIFRDSAIFSDPDENNFYSTDDTKPTKSESPMKPKIFYKKFNNINEKKIIPNKTSVENGSLKIQCQKSDVKQSIEISLDTVERKIETVKKNLNMKENDEVKTKKIENEPKVSRLAPPVPIKPVFSKTTTQIMKCSINGKSFSDTRKSQEISLPEKPINKPSTLKLPENTSNESEKPDIPSPVKLLKPGIPKPSFQRSTSSNINMKRMSFERCSLDSSSISRRSKSVSVYKMDGNDNPVEEITITKSVQERRKEIEMMAENSSKSNKGDDSPPAFSRSISFKMNSGTTITKPACAKRIPTIQKSNIPTCNGNVDKENNDIVDVSDSPISDKNDNAKGGWVKHVVNRFQ